MKGKSNQLTSVERCAVLALTLEGVALHKVASQRTIHTFIQATALILNPIHATATASASHSQPGFNSNHQYIDIEIKQTKEE
jgi:multisubunit Na+/H+ antiporter MnhG subunit